MLSVELLLMLIMFPFEYVSIDTASMALAAARAAVNEGGSSTRFFNDGAALAARYGLAILHKTHNVSISRLIVALVNKGELRCGRLVVAAGVGDMLIV